VFLWVIVGVISYFFLSYHLIFIDGKARLLKKSSFSLDYTFFSTHAKDNEKILAIDKLREDGIGDLLVELGRMSEDEKERLAQKYELDDD
jgi:hypothetical protein